MFTKRNRSRRGLRLESLENRMLLASDSFHNFLSPHDVNDDSRVSSADALAVINHLNRGGSRDDSKFVDVNDDGRASAQDALMIINALNIESSRTRSTDDAIAQLSRNDGVRVKFEYEVESSKVKLDIKVQNAAANTEYAVLIDGVMIGTMTTNSRGRGELELGSRRGSQPLPSNLPAIHSGTVAEIVGIGETSFTPGSSSSNSTSNNSSSNSSSGSIVEDNPSRSNDDNSSSSSSSSNNSKSSSSSSSGVEDNPSRSNDDNSSSNSSSSNNSSSSSSSSSGVEDSPSRSNDDNSSSSSSSSNNSSSSSSSSSGVEDNPSRSNDDNSSSSSSSSSNTSTSPSVGSALELKTNLSGDSSIEAKASFERTSSSVEFKVELRDAPSNSTYNVNVAGVLVGTLRTDSRGRGKLAFELGDNSKPFPSVFPAIEVGTTITVGNELAGTFRRDSN